MRKKKSLILEAVYETVKGLYDAGVMDRVTLLEFDRLCLPAIEPLKTVIPNTILPRLVMAEDLFHNTVKIALQKDGWRITADPYQLRYGVADVYIDLAAEEAIAAEKEGRKIAVEIKSFAGGSTISEFHTALGQFLNYLMAIEVSEEPERTLYLAVPTDTSQMFLRLEPAKTVIERYKVRLIVYNPKREEIDQWIE